MGPRDVGLIGDVVATLEEAALHAYSTSAAVDAALSHLDGATVDQAKLIAAVLAAWLATDLDPSVKTTDLTWWLRLASNTVTRQAAP